MGGMGTLWVRKGYERYEQFRTAHKSGAQALKQSSEEKKKGRQRVSLSHLKLNVATVPRKKKWWQAKCLCVLEGFKSKVTFQEMGKESRSKKVGENHYLSAGTVWSYYTRMQCVPFSLWESMPGKRVIHPVLELFSSQLIRKQNNARLESVRAEDWIVVMPMWLKWQPGQGASSPSTEELQASSTNVSIPCQCSQHGEIGDSPREVPRLRKWSSSERISGSYWELNKAAYPLLNIVLLMESCCVELNLGNCLWALLASQSQYQLTLTWFKRQRAFWDPAIFCEIMPSNNASSWGSHTSGKSYGKNSMYSRERFWNNIYCLSEQKNSINP